MLDIKYETNNYVVVETKSGDFELLRKVGKRTMLLNRSQYQTALIVAARNLEG